MSHENITLIQTNKRKQKVNIKEIDNPRNIKLKIHLEGECEIDIGYLDLSNMEIEQDDECEIFIINSVFKTVTFYLNHSVRMINSQIITQVANIDHCYFENVIIHPSEKNKYMYLEADSAKLVNINFKCVSHLNNFDERGHDDFYISFNQCDLKDVLFYRRGNGCINVNHVKLHNKVYRVTDEIFNERDFDLCSEYQCFNVFYPIVDDEISVIILTTNALSISNNKLFGDKSISLSTWDGEIKLPKSLKKEIKINTYFDDALIQMVEDQINLRLNIFRTFESMGKVSHFDEHNHSYDINNLIFPEGTDHFI